jgi:hypothetical protein
MVQTTCDADDKEGNLVKMFEHEYYMSHSNRTGSDIHAVIHNNFGPVAPNIVEQVHHDSDGLVPH